MSAGVIYTSREEIEVYRFNYAATFFIPLAALLLQSYLPVAFHGRLYFFDVFDLPLLVTIFFGVARRNPVAGSITGAIIGLAQDAMTHNYLGLFGIAKTFVGKSRLALPDYRGLLPASSHRLSSGAAWNGAAKCSRQLAAQPGSSPCQWAVGDCGLCHSG